MGMPLLPEWTTQGLPCGCPKISMDGLTVTGVTACCVSSELHSVPNGTCPVTSGPSTFPHCFTRSRTIPLRIRCVYPGTSSEKWPFGSLATRATFIIGQSARMSLRWGVNTYSALRNSSTKGGFSTTGLKTRYLGIALQYTFLGKFKRALIGRNPSYSEASPSWENWVLRPFYELSLLWASSAIAADIPMRTDLLSM